MKVAVINGSPSGKNSITLQTVLYISKYYSDSTFDILHIGNNLQKMPEVLAGYRENLESADMILFCYPVYTFLAPAQLQTFIHCMKVDCDAGRLNLSGKAATQITTSKHFYDTTAHRYVNENCMDMGMRVIRGLSADMEDLTHEKGQQEALAFFAFAQYSFDNTCFEQSSANNLTWDCRVAAQPESDIVRDSRKVAIVADLPAEGADGVYTRLDAMIKRFQAQLPFESEVINLREFPFAGGCLGCFHCAADGKCIYKDGFDDYLRTHIQNTEAIVYAYSIEDHSMGTRMKLFDDRQFCNGHRTVTMGKPVGYLVDGPLSQEENLRTLMEARSEVGGNFLAGIAGDERDPDAEVDQLAKMLTYAINTKYLPPKNFYGVGGMKIFRDLIYQMRGLMREDHRFYKEHGFYDFPQKRKGTILGMYAVGAMMNNPFLRKKMGEQMTRGMLMPYQKVIEQAEIRFGKKEEDK